MLLSSLFLFSDIYEDAGVDNVSEFTDLRLLIIRYFYELENKEELKRHDFLEFGYILSWGERVFNGGEADD